MLIFLKNKNISHQKSLLSSIVAGVIILGGIVNSSLPVFARDNRNEIHQEWRRKGWEVRPVKWFNHTSYAASAVTLALTGPGAPYTLLNDIADLATAREIFLALSNSRNTIIRRQNHDFMARVLTYKHWHNENPCSLWGGKCWKKVSEPNTHELVILARSSKINNRTKSRIRLGARKSHNSCPLNGSFARQILWNSRNNGLAIRCSRSANANINESQYWTRPFMTLDSRTGAIKNVQSASCPKGRFVNEIVYKGTTVYIRCRWVKIKNSVGQWSTGRSYFTRPFLSSDLKSIQGAECPDDSAIAEVLKLNDGRLAIRCRRVIVNGSRLNIDESRYWTIYFANRK